MNTTPVATIDTLKTDAVSVDTLRKQLRVHEAVSDLNDVAQILRYDWENMSKNQIDANRLRVEIARIKLAKVLPDMKAMEHTAGTGDTSKVQFILNLGDEGKKVL